MYLETAVDNTPSHSHVSSLVTPTPSHPHFTSTPQTPISSLPHPHPIYSIPSHHLPSHTHTLTPTPSYPHPDTHTLIPYTPYPHTTYLHTPTPSHPQPHPILHTLTPLTLTLHTLTPPPSTFPQARAPHSPVIIVGTHLDKLSSKSQKMELTQSLEYIAATYGTDDKRREGYPQVRRGFPPAVTESGWRKRFPTGVGREFAISLRLSAFVLSPL